METHIRRWFKPWVLSALVGLVVFGTFHQFLVVWAPTVYLGLFMALVMSIPIVAAYATMDYEQVDVSGPIFGLVIFAGMVPHYVFITIGMWNRASIEGPRGGWQLLAIVSAPLVAGLLCWFLWHSVRGTVWLVGATFLAALMLSGNQQTNPSSRNLGALLCLLPAFVAAGWTLQRTRASVDARSDSARPR